MCSERLDCCLPIEGEALSENEVSNMREQEDEFRRQENESYIVTSCAAGGSIFDSLLVVKALQCCLQHNHMVPDLQSLFWHMKRLILQLSFSWKMVLRMTLASICSDGCCLNA